MRVSLRQALLIGLALLLWLFSITVWIATVFALFAWGLSTIKPDAVHALPQFLRPLYQWVTAFPFDFAPIFEGLALIAASVASFSFAKWLWRKATMLPLTLENEKRPPDDEIELRRNELLDSIQRVRIDSFKDRFIYAGAKHDFNIVEVPLLVRPKRVVTPLSGERDGSLPPVSDMSSVFQQADGSLLVTGLPGAGKTTSVIELTEALLEQARQDPKAKIPVALNLNYWTERDNNLAIWLQQEIQQNFGIEARFTRYWLKAGKLTLLLDGLDEIPSLELRRSCVNAINAHRAAHHCDVVVTSRKPEYEQLKQPLEVNTSVEILPLDESDINEYLLKLGASGDTLRDLMNKEPRLWEMAKTPLLLSAMTIAMPRITDRQLGEGDISARQVILDAYIEEQVLRVEHARRSTPYGRWRVLSSLNWLAWSMTLIGGAYFSIDELVNFPVTSRHQDLYVGSIGKWMPTHIRTLTIGWSIALSIWILAHLFGASSLSISRLLQRPATVSSAFLLTGLTIVLVDIVIPGYTRTKKWSEGKSRNVPKRVVSIDTHDKLGEAIVLLPLLVQAVSWSRHIVARLEMWMHFWSPLYFRAYAQNKRAHSRLYVRIEFYARALACAGLLLVFLVIANGTFGEYGELLGSVAIFAIASVFALSVYFDMSMPRIFFSLDGALPWRYEKFLRHAVELKFMYWNGRNYAFIHNVLQVHFALLDPARLFPDESKPTNIGGGALVQRWKLTEKFLPEDQESQNESSE